MGYLDKTAQTVTAHFTKRGRELLADALSGNTTGDYIITKFALGDDEIDYSLWDMTPSGSNFVRPLGQVIDNQPLVEAVVSENEIMNHFLTKRQPVFTTTPETQK